VAYLYFKEGGEKNMTGYGDLHYEKDDFLTSDQNKKLKSILEEREKLRKSDKPWYITNSQIDKLEAEYDRLKTVASLRRKYGW